MNMFPYILKGKKYFSHNVMLNSHIAKAFMASLVLYVPRMIMTRLSDLAGNTHLDSGWISPLTRLRKLSDLGPHCYPRLYKAFYY